MDQKFIDNTVSTLQTALSLIESPQDAFGRDTPAPTQRQLTIIAEGIKSASAKVGFMFTQNKALGKDAAASLIKALCDAATALCVLCATAIGHAPSGSVTLQRAVSSTATKLVSATVDLVRAAAAAPGRSDAWAADVVQKAAKCMEYCDTACKTPLDGKTAIGKAFVGVVRQLNDAAKELEEHDGDDSALVSLLDDQVDDADMPHTKTADAEKTLELCKKASLLLSAVKIFVQAVMRALVLHIQREKSAATEDGHEDCAIEKWESILVNGYKLGCSGDDLAAAIYENSDDDVKIAVEQLIEWCNTIYSVHLLDGDDGDYDAVYGDVKVELEKVQEHARVSFFE